MTRTVINFTCIIILQYLFSQLSCSLFICLQKISELKKKLTLYKEKPQLFGDPKLDLNSDTKEDSVIDELVPQSTDDSNPGADSTAAASATNCDSEEDTASATNCDSEEDTAPQNSTDKHLPTESLQTVSKVPNRLQLDVGDTEARGVAVDPTGCLSPTSYSTFKEFLNHTPDLNLPWQPMRSVSQCGCGMPFSYSRRKVRVTMK